MALVEVTWVDAFSQLTGWGDARAVARDADDSMEVQSVGHLIARTRRHVVLAMNRSGGRVADTMSIPHGCVRRVRRLR